MTEFNWRKYDESYWGIQLASEGPAWREYRIDNPSGSVTCRSMVMRYELAMLYALARDHYSGEGAIVDGGPLTGLTTNALARGWLANPDFKSRARRIHAFDLFDYIPSQDTLEFVPNRNGSLLDTFLDVNHDYLDMVSVCAGDLLTHQWNSGPIEICMVDLAKTWGLNGFVIDNWFTNLTPGAYVVQQDYCAIHCYWLPITMMALKGYFEFVDYAMGSSNVFRCLKPVPPGTAAWLRSLSFSTYEQLLDEAIASAPAPIVPVLQCSKAMFYVASKMPERALAILANVNVDRISHDWATDFHGVALGSRDTCRFFAGLSPGQLDLYQIDPP